MEVIGGLIGGTIILCLTLATAMLVIGAVVEPLLHIPAIEATANTNHDGAEQVADRRRKRLEAIIEKEEERIFRLNVRKMLEAELKERELAEESGGETFSLADLGIDEVHLWKP